MVHDYFLLQLLVVVLLLVSVVVIDIDRTTSHPYSTWPDDAGLFDATKITDIRIGSGTGSRSN